MKSLSSNHGVDDYKPFLASVIQISHVFLPRCERRRDAYILLPLLGLCSPVTLELASPKRLTVIPRHHPLSLHSGFF